MKVDKNQLELMLEISELAAQASRIASEAKRMLSGEIEADLNEVLVLRSGELAEARARYEEIQRELQRLEADLALVEKRISTDQQRLNETSNPKDAIGISHELETLAKRKLELEELELGVMEELEQAESLVSEAQAARAAAEAQLESQRADTVANVTALKSQHSALLEDVKAKRALLPTDLLEAFDLRAKRGVPIGRLASGTCGACRMSLTASALNEISKAADDLSFCPECAAILVLP